MADVRREAAAALGRREGQDVTAALLAGLGDPVADVRRQAVQALAGREGQEVTWALLARLGNPNTRVRRRGAEPLVVRRQVVQALAGREGQRVTMWLLARLGDPDADLRRQVVQALAGREGQDVTAALLARLGDPDADLCRQAVQALAGREGQDVTTALLACLGDPDADLCRQAVQALAGREGQDVTTALLACLDNPRLHQQAMQALGERGSSRDLLVLAQGMNRMALPPSEWLGAAYRLTTAFYNALSAGEREMTRAAVGRITPVLPQDTALEPVGDAPAGGPTVPASRPAALCQMRDGTWQAVKVITLQRDGDRWRCLLQWGVSGAEYEGWYIHNPQRLRALEDGRPPET